MPEVKYKDSKTGNVRTIRYEGTPPTSEEILKLFEAETYRKSPDVGQGDVRRQEALERGTTPVIRDFPQQAPFQSILQPTPTQGDGGTLKALQAQYGKDVQGKAPSNIRPLETPGTKKLSEPASGTLLPLLAGGVLAPLVGGGLAGGLATGALAGAGASARAAQIGGALASAAGGAGTSMLTQPIAESYARATDPQGMAQIERGRAGVRQASPTADILLNTLPQLLIGKPSLRPGLVDAALGAGIGGAQEGYQQFKEGQFDPTALLTAMGVGGLMSGQLTREGQAIASSPTIGGFKAGAVSSYLGKEGAKRVRANREANTDAARAARARNVTGEATTPAPAPRKSAKPGNLLTGETSWRVTDYGQADPTIEKTPDRNSVVLRKGAWENGLDKDSVAVSPDVEAQLRAANIKPHDWVEFKLANGRTVVKRWDDRTSDNLTGRVDFFNPSEIDPNRGAAVVGFTRVGKGKPLPLGSNPSASTVPAQPSDSQTVAPPKPLKTNEEVLAEIPKPVEAPQAPTKPVQAQSGADAIVLPQAPESPVKKPSGAIKRTGYEEAEIAKARTQFNVKPEEQVDGVAYTSDNQPVPYRWKVVDIDDLITSHTDDLQETPGYPQEIQNRDRTGSAVSWKQVGDIKTDPNPMRLGSNPMTTDGAPIAGADNFVESGNGRTIGLRIVYKDPKLAKQRRRYEDFARNYAQEFLGIDTTGIKRPVLVRERVGELDLAARSDLARRMNSGSVMQRTRGESAEFDASRVEKSGALASYQLGAGLGDASSRGFVEQFFKDLPTEELTQVFDDRTRTINKQGEDRILSALLAYAYKSAPEGQAIIKTVASGSDDGIGKNLANSMTQSAPDFAKLTYEQSRGAFDFPASQGGKGDYDLAAPLSAAARALASFKSRNEARSWIEQQKTGDLLGGSLTDPEQIAVMETLAQDEYSRSSAKTTELLRKYAELAYKAGTEQTLDGSARPTKIQLFKKADAIVRGVAGEEQEGFDFTEKPKEVAKPEPATPAPSDSKTNTLSLEEKDKQFLTTYIEEKSRKYGVPATKRAQGSIADLTSSPLVYHQTSAANAVGLISRVRQGYRTHASLWVSDNPDLALGQKGSAVTIVFKSDMVNGFKNDRKPGLELTEARGAGTEFNLDKTTKRSIEKVIVRTEVARKKLSETFPGLTVELAGTKPAQPAQPVKESAETLTSSAEPVKKTAESIQVLDQIPETRFVEGKSLGEWTKAELESRQIDPEVRAQLVENKAFETVLDFNFKNKTQAERSLARRAENVAAKNEATLFKEAQTVEDAKKALENTYEIKSTAREQISKLADWYINRATEAVKARRDYIAKYGQESYDKLPSYVKDSTQFTLDAIKTREEWDNDPAAKIKYLFDQPVGSVVNFAKKINPKEQALLSKLEQAKLLTRRVGDVDKEAGKVAYREFDNSYGGDSVYIKKGEFPAIYQDPQKNFNALGQEVKGAPSDVRQPEAPKPAAVKADPEQTYVTAIKKGEIRLTLPDGSTEIVEFLKLKETATERSLEENEAAISEYFDRLRELAEGSASSPAAAKKLVKFLGDAEEEVNSEFSFFSDTLSDKPVRNDYERGEEGSQEYKDALQEWKGEWANVQTFIYDLHSTLFDVAKQLESKLTPATTPKSPATQAPKATAPVTPEKAVAKATESGKVDLESMTLEDIMALKKRGKSSEAINAVKKRMDDVLDNGPC